MKDVKRRLCDDKNYGRRFDVPRRSMLLSISIILLEITSRTSPSTSLWEFLILTSLFFISLETGVFVHDRYTRGTVSPRFSSNSEAFASELLENHVEHTNRLY